MAEPDPVARLAGHRVLVVGDLVLDEYLTGRPSRVSREAPVLVLDEVEREYRAGSAGNPAANVASLGSRATVVGVLGNDPPGERLAAELERQGVGLEGLVRLPDAATARKTRVLAQGYTGGLFGRQQVLRLDRVPPLPPAAAAACAERVVALAPSHDVVLISDYRAGVAADAVVQAARASGKPLVVDSQGDLRRFHGATLVKVNLAEAQAALGRTAPLDEAENLRRSLDLDCLAITLGAEGMELFTAHGRHHAPAASVTEVFDVTGAGDTVIAVLALALAGGLDLPTAARLANAAASLVVRRLGVACVTPDEVRDALRQFAPGG